MEHVFRETLKELENGIPCVLATVINTEGSTPQKAGAKLLIREDGSGSGTLGGGCMEGNIWYLAKKLLDNHGGSQTNDYELNKDIDVRDGMVCGGTMRLLLEPIRESHSFRPYLKEILAAYKGEQTVALATLVKPPGGCELQVGEKLLVREDGSCMGSLGHPKLDKEAVKRAGTLMAYGNNAYLQTPDGSEVFVEAYTSPPTLVLMGAGHVNKALSYLAKIVGFLVYVIDDRPEFANPELFPHAKVLINKEIAVGLTEVPVNRNTYIIVGTRGHRDDDRALEAAARTRARYLGLLGSKRKVILIYEELMRKGISLERIREIHAPIGVDIHARTPEEIAISIMAELIKFRLGGSGTSLKLDEKQIIKVWERVHRKHALAGE